MPQTKWSLRPKHVQYNWLELDALSLVGPIEVQLLDICCSSVLVRVLLFNSHLVSTQCCWILIYMIAVLMHRRIRSPSRGPNTLYVLEPQQNIGRCFFVFFFCFFNVKRFKHPSPLPPIPRPHPVIFPDRSNAVLLLWFILIVSVRPLSVCLFILFRIAWWPSHLGVLLLLFLFYAV